MQMTKYCLAAVLVLLSTTPAHAAGEFEKGVALYGKADYQAALPLLEAAIKSGKAKDATAHYYLANTYLQLGRQAEALREYSVSLRLDPSGPSSGYCQQAINRISSTVTSQSASLPYPAVAPVDTGQSGANSKPMSSSPKAIDDSNVVARLPQIPMFRDIEPPRQLLSMSYGSRLRNLERAQQILKQAEDRYDDAKRLLDRAQSMTKTLVPNSRAYGETEADFNTRLTLGQQRQKQLLEPYNKYVDVCRNSLEQTTAIVKTFDNATSGGNDGSVNP